MAMKKMMLGGLAMATAGKYTIDTSFVGTDFFSEDKWDFFHDADPTNGKVQYVDRQTALDLKLVNATEKSVYLGTDMTSVLSGDEGRKSVRIESKKTWESGLFVMTVDHQPTGCGIWPAWWLFGTDADHPWPVWGEIDLIEGAHGGTKNACTLHTEHNCDQSMMAAGQDFSGVWGMTQQGKPATNCSVHDPTQDKNQGCSQVGVEGSMGEPFNKNGGGTFAVEWDPAAGFIRAWFFKMGTEPQDLVSKAPTPSEWGLPYAFFRLADATCPTSSFRTQHMIINIDFCGEWGFPPEDVFHKDCPHITETCNEYVAKNPDKLQEAYWSFSVLDVYQQEQSHQEVELLV